MMADILVIALQLRNKEKKVLAITQFVDNVQEYINDVKERGFITSKDNCQAPTFGFIVPFSDIRLPNS